MNACGKNDETTGNKTFNSYAMKSHELVFAFTAPARTEEGGFRRDVQGNLELVEEDKEIEEEKRRARQFVDKHGLAVKRVCLRVETVSYTHLTLPTTPYV